MCAQVWAVGLDSCDDALSILKRDLDTGTLTPTTLVRPVNPNGNSINIDKASRAERFRSPENSHPL